MRLVTNSPNDDPGEEGKHDDGGDQKHLKVRFGERDVIFSVQAHVSLFLPVCMYQLVSGANTVDRSVTNAVCSVVGAGSAMYQRHDFHASAP